MKILLYIVCSFLVLPLLAGQCISKRRDIIYRQEMTQMDFMLGKARYTFLSDCNIPVIHVKTAEIDFYYVGANPKKPGVYSLVGFDRERLNKHIEFINRTIDAKRPLIHDSKVDQQVKNTLEITN